MLAVPVEMEEPEPATVIPFEDMDSGTVYAPLTGTLKLKAPVAGTSKYIFKSGTVVPPLMMACDVKSTVDEVAPLKVRTEYCPPSLFGAR